MGPIFFFNNTLLGVGLAMDAFSVSLANGLRENRMCKRKMCAIAGLFALFQGLMPLLGWICVHTVLEYFQSFEILIPWIALGLLCWIGGNMIYDCIKQKDEPQEDCAINLKSLLIQGVATSIDALSVGFTIAEYDFPTALAAVGLIAAVTFLICLLGVYIGKKAGTALADKAGFLGGGILIFIGLEIFITSWF